MAAPLRIGFGSRKIWTEHIKNYQRTNFHAFVQICTFPHENPPNSLDNEALEQMGSRPITFWWLWTATEHEPHCRHVPLTKFEGGLNLLHEADDDADIWLEPTAYSECSTCKITHTHALTHTPSLTHARTFNGPLSRNTWVSQYQKGKTNLDLLKQEIVSGSGISRAIRKSAPRSRQITTPTPHHSVFYRPYALPAAQPTASKHWRNCSLAK